MWIRISFNADPDPAFFVNADPDPGFFDTLDRVNFVLNFLQTNFPLFSLLFTFNGIKHDASSTENAKWLGTLELLQNIKFEQ